MKISRTTYSCIAGDFGIGALLGVLAGIGQPGINLPVAFFVSYVAFCWLALRSPTWLRVVCISVAWGVAALGMVFIGTSSWGAHVTATAVVAGIFCYALPTGIWSRWAHRKFGNQLHLFIATAAFWGAWQECIDLLGLPVRGANLSLTQFPDLLAGIRLVGTPVIEGIVLATCLCVAVVIADHNKRIRARITHTLMLFGAGTSILSLLAILAHGTAPAANATIVVGIPQINVGRDYYEGRLVNSSADRLFAERFDKMLTDISEVDLLVMSETYDGRFGLLFPSTRDRWRNWSGDYSNSVLVTSFMVDDTGHRINAMAAINKGVWVGIHEKIDLAPFGEVALTAGAERKPLRLSKNTDVGILICNEAFLRHPSRELADAGANLLVATVNDVSFGSSLVVFSHLAQARLRAIEVGRSIVWASNAGPSGVIDRWGNLSTMAPFRHPVAIRAVAEIHNLATPLQHYRWAPVAVCVSVLLVLIIKIRRSNVAYNNNDKPTSVFPHSYCGTWREYTLSFIGITLSIVAVATSPAMVEMQSGDPARAVLAVQELLHGPTIVADPNPYARFRNMPSKDLAAVAYFLEYFGAEESMDNLVADLNQAPTLEMEQIAISLINRIGLRTRVLVVDPDNLPRVAALTRLADGRLVVANQPNINGLVSFFDAATGQAVVLTMKQFIELGPSNFLIPSQPL